MTGPSDCFDRDRGAFERLDATDEQQHRLVAETQRLASTDLVAGREERVVDAGRHHLDPRRLGVVVVLELIGLGPRVGDDDVAAPDDLGLGVDAPLRLGITGVGLDPGEGVEHRHQRQVERVLDAVRGDTRQPIVRVQRVDIAVGSQVVDHEVGELVDRRQQLFLRQRRGAGGHVHDPETGLDGDDRRQIVAPAAHVHRRLHARLRERRHELAHVDVHATRHHPTPAGATATSAS